MWPYGTVRSAETLQQSDAFVSVPCDGIEQALRVVLDTAATHPQT